MNGQALSLKTRLCVTLFILSFSMSSVFADQGKPLEGIAAIVNDQLILLSEFEQAWSAYVSNLKNKNIVSEKQLRERLINHLIMLKLQESSARKNGIRVNEREINSSIEVIAKRNKLSLDQLYAQLKKQGQSIKKFREEVRQQMIVQRLQQQLFIGRVQVSDVEVDELVKRDRQLKDPLEYQLQKLLIRPPRNDREAWSESEIKIQQIRNEVINGQPFERAIALYSNSNHSFEPNKLEWQDSSTLPDSFHSVLLNMKVGQVSQIIKTGRGYFLIKLVGKQHKNKIRLNRYKFERIFLPLASYDDLGMAQIRKEIVQKLGEDSQSFAHLAKQYSQDQYASRGGKTDWLKTRTFESSLEFQAQFQEPSQMLHTLVTQDGWLLYRLIGKEKYDASDEAIRRTIKQRLIFSKVQEQYDNYLRNLRLNAAVQINI